MLNAALEGALDDLKFVLGLPIAISIGFDKLTENDFPQTVLNRADKALYYAKEQGKDRILSYQELLDSGTYQDKRKTGSTELF